MDPIFGNHVHISYYLAPIPLPLPCQHIHYKKFAIQFSENEGVGSKAVSNFFRNFIRFVSASLPLDCYDYESTCGAKKLENLKEGEF